MCHWLNMKTQCGFWLLAGNHSTLLITTWIDTKILQYHIKRSQHSDFAVKSKH